ncbi:MAG TPA: serine/threonine-protein kinase [Bacteroidota bacterium]
MSNQGLTLEEKLSESSTTAVFRAYQTALHRTVLVKVLHKHLANDTDIQARFAREARACALLHSPHIVQVYDLTEVDGTPAIVMEFVRGKSLKQLLENGQPLPFELVRTVAVSVLQGLDVAHAHGVIHRDLKPGNILVAESGTVKITDFGLATLASSASVTNEGMVLGTPAYMSPEQIRGETLDGRTDFFSLGATLVEMATGKKIFDGSSYAECTRKIAGFREEALADLVASMPEEFRQFLRRLMAQARESRFPSAREALAALGIQGNEATIPQGVHRNSKAVPIAAIAASLLVLIGALTLWNRNSKIAGRAQPDSAISAATTNELQSIPKSNMQLGKTDRPGSAAVIPSSVQDPSPGSGAANVSSADSGFLFVTAKPWAKVYLNSTFIGETPFAKPVKVKPGTYTVTFNCQMFGPIVKTARISPNANTVLEANFLEQAGFVSLQVNPWAYVYVDDQYYDVTPFSKPMVLPSGSRRLRFHNPAFDDITRTVDIKAGDTLKLSVNYSTPADGSRQ